jgi:hypothetical protein
MYNNKEMEIRNNNFLNHNCYSRKTKNGIEYFNKDFFDCNFARIEDDGILNDILDELNN